MRVIKFNNITVQFPVFQSIVIWLLLDRIKVPGWFKGSIWTIWFILWVACILVFFLEEKVDIFEYIDNKVRGKNG